MTSEYPPVLAWRHAVRDLASGGTRFAKDAKDEERAVLAKALDIVSVERLTVTYRLSPAAGGVKLEGRIAAEVVQACVVTLDPVPAKLSIDMDALFREGATDEEDEVEVSSDSDLDAPVIEPMHNGEIDVGRIVVEEVLAALDPYPRAADAALDVSEAGAPGPEDHPFAALARLKTPVKPS